MRLALQRLQLTGESPEIQRDGFSSQLVGGAAQRFTIVAVDSQGNGLHGLLQPFAKQGQQLLNQNRVVSTLLQQACFIREGGRVIVAREHASNLLSETLLADGFGNVAVETHLKTALFIPLHGVCRHGDGGLRRSGPGAFFFTQQANGGFTVHLWHLKIDQQNVPHARAPAFQQCDAIIDDLTGVPEPLKQARGDLLVDQIIFRKQDPEPGRVRRDGGRGRAFTHRLWCTFKRRGNRLMQFILGDRFMQVVLDTDPLQHIDIKMSAHGAQHDDMAFSNLRQHRKFESQRHAVHIRHLRVQQDQGPCRSGFNPVDGLAGVINAGGFQPHLAKHGGQ